MSFDAQAAMSSNSPTAAEVGFVDGTAEANLVSDTQTARRSDPRERRAWLLFLDPVLTDEIRWAGTLSCEELIDLAVRPLKGRASRETIQEWWEYAWRRGWLVAHEADRFQLTDLARTDLQARRESLWQPNPFDWAKALAKWMLPAGAIGLAGYWTGKSGMIALTILGLCLTFILGLIFAGTMMRWIDRPTDRMAARRACDWLDGRFVALSLAFRSETRGEVLRLYGCPSQIRP